MNKETAQFLVNVTEHCGNQEANLRENYSGRGMYGEKTCAIVVDSETQLITDLIQYMADNVCDTEDGENQGWCGGPIPNVSSLRFHIDSMGLHSVVIY